MVKGNNYVDIVSKCSIKYNFIFNFKGKPFNKILQSEIGILDGISYVGKNMIKLLNCILMVGQTKKLELKI